VIAIAMGASASNPSFKGEWLVGVVLSLMLVASLWWSYFDREDRRAADKLVQAAPEERSRMGILGYWYAHLALLGHRADRCGDQAIARRPSQDGPPLRRDGSLHARGRFLQMGDGHAAHHRALPWRCCRAGAGISRNALECASGALSKSGGEV